MKKLMWTLLSLMLFLGLGTASAQPSAPVIVSPANNATVSPGQKLKVAKNEDYVIGMEGTLLFYTINDEASLNINPNDAEDIFMASYYGEPLNDIYACYITDAALNYDPDDPTVVIANWMPTPAIPEDASGTVRWRARALDMKTGDLSAITTMTYTVGAGTSVPEPIISKASGAVPTGTKVTISLPSTGDGGSYQICYVLNDPDYDFSQYKCYDNGMCEGPMVPTNMVYQNPIVITENTTVTAITMKYDMVWEKVLGWSQPVTANYTIGGEVAPPASKPAAPTFNPDGGGIVSGGKITLTNGTESDATPLKIYYNFNDDNGASITKFTTQEALTKEVNMQYTATVFLYAEPGIEITEAKKIQALTANVNEDGLITWSDVTAKAFTIVTKPAAPTFNPDGSSPVAAGTKVILTNGTESDATPLKIYYNTKTTGTAEFDAVKTEAQLTAALKNLSKKLIAYPAGGIEITKNTPINAATANIDAAGNVIWSEVIMKNFSLIVVKPNAPTFSPDGGEVEAGEGITIETTTPGAKIYYIDGTTASFVNLTTESDLDAAEQALVPTAISYSATYKPTLSEFSVETPGAKCSISAAAVIIAADGTLTWSDPITKEFTVKAEPVPGVVAPVITPGNDAVVHMGDKVTITCATEQAEIYYTTDGTAPFDMDADGNPVSVKEGALKYTVPFALTESMLVKQGNSYSLRIRAVATKGDEMSKGASAGYVVYPNAPKFVPGAGIVKRGTEVAISCVPSQTKIYYTTDGTTPTEETGTEYTAPIAINAAMTVKAIAVLGQYQSSASAAYTIGIDGQPEFEPAKGYVKPGGELNCTVPQDVLKEYKQVFVLYAENDADAVLESDIMTLMQIAGNKPDIAEGGDVTAPEVSYKVAVVEYDETKQETTWAKPVVISEDAPAEVKFRARMAVLEQSGNGDEMPLLYSREMATTYYTVVPAPKFKPEHGLVTAGQELNCTVPESFDWEQGNNTAFLVYVENNDDLKLEEISADDIIAAMYPTDQEQGAGAAAAYKVAVCIRDFDEDDAPVYEWQIPVALSKDAEGTISFRARLVMMTQSQDENIATFSNEVKAYYYTELPAPRFADAGEVLQSDALNVEFPAAVDFSYYLDQAFILYVENNTEAVLEYNGTMGELQALAQGGNSALPDEPEEGGFPALSAKAALPYSVAVYDAELEEWSPAVFLTTLGQVNVRARLAVGTAWDGQLIYSDEFTATYTVKERPVLDAPKFVVNGAEVTGQTVAVKKGAELSFLTGYDNEDYFVCYVIDGKDEDFKNASMTAINMGTSPVKVYDPEIAEKLVINEAKTIKAATAQLLASGDIWWSEIGTVAFTIAPDDTVATPAFNPAAGEVEKGTKVEISCATKEAKIYYTVDGGEPTAESTEYTTAIEINAAMTIKAIAIKDDVKSKVAEAAYTVKTANEGEELAGVKVYPNPSNGLFNIELPVSGTIEVFMSNGMLYQRLTLNEGHNTLNIERSGIYFFRITGEGRTVIKRVIVR